MASACTVWPCYFGVMHPLYLKVPQWARRRTTNSRNTNEHRLRSWHGSAVACVAWPCVACRDVAVCAVTCRQRASRDRAWRAVFRRGRAVGVHRVPSACTAPEHLLISLAACSRCSLLPRCRSELICLKKKKQTTSTSNRQPRGATRLSPREGLCQPGILSVYSVNSSF